MLKKTIKYVDYDGETRTEDFYFNLSKAEVMEMEMSVAGGMANKLTKITESKDPPLIMKTFKELILKSYGEKSDDGRRFIKSEELSTAFLQTEAYSKLFMELCTNAGAASEFVNGVLPDVPVSNHAGTAPGVVNGVLPDVTGSDHAVPAAD